VARRWNFRRRPVVVGLGTTMKQAQPVSPHQNILIPNMPHDIWIAGWKIRPLHNWGYLGSVD
jgi:hypothetical protein